MTIEESRFESATTSSNSIDFTGDVLLLPCVSIGSVPQLAIDALLDDKNATQYFGQSAQFIGTLDHRFCVPFLGGVSNSQDSSLQGPLRLYRFDKAKVTIVQQRSPILKSRKHDFVKQLMDWIQRKGFANVVVLTSLDAGLRSDSQMNIPYWYMDSGVQGKTGIQSRIQSILPIYQSDAQPSSSTTSLKSSKKKNPLPAMPSGGLAKLYLQAAVDNLKHIPLQALVTFAAEGDNRYDALTMADLVLELLSLSKDSSSQQLTQPNDWSLLFGHQTNTGMFS